MNIYIYLKTIKKFEVIANVNKNPPEVSFREYFIMETFVIKGTHMQIPLRRVHEAYGGIVDY